jgi:hypothetical protein
MELALTKHRPQLKHFALVLAVTMLLYALAFMLAQLIFWAAVSDATIKEFWLDMSSSSGIWLFPLSGGILHAFSFQRHELTITGIDDSKKIADWAVHSLQKEGREILTQDTAETVLASTNRYYKLFNYWLGAELVHIRYTEDKISIVGHYRHIDLIESEIKFGKPVFN